MRLRRSPGKALFLGLRGIGVRLRPLRPSERIKARPVGPLPSHPSGDGPPTTPDERKATRADPPRVESLGCTPRGVGGLGALVTVDSSFPATPVCEACPVMRLRAYPSSGRDILPASRAG